MPPSDAISIYGHRYLNCCDQQSDTDSPKHCARKNESRSLYYDKQCESLGALAEVKISEARGQEIQHDRHARILPVDQALLSLIDFDRRKVCVEKGENPQHQHDHQGFADHCPGVLREAQDQGSKPATQRKHSSRRLVAVELSQARDQKGQHKRPSRALVPRFRGEGSHCQISVQSERHGILFALPIF